MDGQEHSFLEHIYARWVDKECEHDGVYGHEGVHRNPRHGNSHRPDVPAMASTIAALVLLLLLACGNGEPSVVSEEPTPLAETYPTEGKVSEEPVSEEPTPHRNETPPKRVDAMEVTSSAFQDGDPIPLEYTCWGWNDLERPLPISIDNEPSDTRSVALIMDSPDAPASMSDASGETFVHWVVFNIAEDVQERKGVNYYGVLGYAGPCPPTGQTHTYLITVYALDRLLDLEEGATAAQLREAMQGSILAQAQLRGTHEAIVAY